MTGAEHLEVPAGDHFPRRVLIISAAMGEGHNAASDALTEAMHECWPGCQVERVDTMELIGPRFARLAQWSYGVQLSVVPWSYEISYNSLSRAGRFAHLSKRALGPFFGLPLAKVLKRNRPDLVISTYPFGSAALDWLRGKRGETVPTVTYIPAFHVHPLWVYPGIDLHFVMYDSAPSHALLPGFEQSMRVGAPPVRKGFGDHDRAKARASAGLPQEDFVVLVTGGAWGLGNLGEGVRALTAVEPAVHVVAVCGKNDSLRQELSALAETVPDRLTVLGYVSTMPELMAAADVVVTNGAGVTVLEALRTPRPVVAFAPLAGHGTASTAEMVRRGLALEARDVPELACQVKRLRSEPGVLEGMEQAGEEWVKGRDLRHSIAEMEALWRSRRAPSPQPLGV